MVVALVKNKYLALSIGPEGFGIYGLLNSFFGLVAVFSGSWMAGGATKYAAQYNGEHDTYSVQKVYSFSVGLTAVLSLIITAILISAHKTIRGLFLPKEVLSIYYLLFTVAFIGTSLRPVIVALLQGLMKVRAIVFSRIAIALVEIALVISLVYLFELKGFFLSILISSVFAAVLLWIQLHKAVGNKFLFAGFKNKWSCL